MDSKCLQVICLKKLKENYSQREEKKSFTIREEVEEIVLKRGERYHQAFDGGVASGFSTTTVPYGLCDFP